MGDGSNVNQLQVTWNCRILCRVWFCQSLFFHIIHNAVPCTVLHVNDAELLNRLLMSHSLLQVVYIVYSSFSVVISTLAGHLLMWLGLLRLFFCKRILSNLLTLPILYHTACLGLKKCLPWFVGHWAFSYWLLPWLWIPTVDF